MAGSLSRRKSTEPNENEQNEQSGPDSKKIVTSSDSIPLRGIRRESPKNSEGTSQFKCYNEILGEGTFKFVYKAIDIEEAHEVAWNELKTRHFNKKAVHKFEEEMKILRMLRHKNILNYHDAWTQRDPDNDRLHSCVFITELMTSGTLKQHLRKLKTNVNPPMMRKWCNQILMGLHYLHTRNPPVIHRDLKCDNIFINGSKSEIKIGDLGLATVKFKDHAESVIGTPEFMAPEMYDEIYTEMVDIYAFGMCVLEMDTRKYPYSECSNAGQVFRKVTKGEMPESLNKMQDGKAKSFILSCVEKNGLERPSAEALLKHSFFDIEQAKEETDEMKENGCRSPPAENVIEFRNPREKASQKVGFLKIVLKKKSDGSQQYQLNTDVNVTNNGNLKRVRVSTVYNTSENSEELANEMISDNLLPKEDRTVFLDAMNKARKEMERRLALHPNTGFSSTELPIKLSEAEGGRRFSHMSVRNVMATDAASNLVGNRQSYISNTSQQSVNGGSDSEVSNEQTPGGSESPDSLVALDEDRIKEIAELKAKIAELEQGNGSTGSVPGLLVKSRTASLSNVNDDDFGQNVSGTQSPATGSDLPDKMFAILDEFGLKQSNANAQTLSTKQGMSNEASR